MSSPIQKWVKSSYSGNGGCVEVAAVGDILVRDTTDRGGPVLAFSPETWRRFAIQVKAERTQA
jgi:hypothetical protein